LLALALLNLDTLAAHLVYLVPPVEPRPLAWELEEPTPGDRRYGPNRLLWSEGIWSALLTGDPYERGQAGAVLTHDLDQALEAELLETFERAVPSALGRFAILRGVGLGMHDIDAHFLPDQLEEIQGFTDTIEDPLSHLGPAYTRRIFYHALHDIGQALVDSPLVVTACTGFMAGGPATADGHWLLARNFDFDGGRGFDEQKIVAFVVPDEGIPYATVTFAGMTGVMSGVNSEGIAIALQAGASDAPARLGMPMTLIAQEIMSSAASLEEAQAILDGRRGLVAENVLVVDGDAGQAALFEVTPDQVERIDVRQTLAVSNHFRSPALADHEINTLRKAEGTTLPRLARMEERVAQAHGQLDMATAVELLRDRRGPGDLPLAPGHRQAIDADIATHSVVIDATDRTIWVSRSPNTAGGYVAYELEEALAGTLRPVEAVAARDIQATLAVHRSRELVRAARTQSPSEAEALARQALALNPEHPEALQALATALQAQGKDAEALPLIRRALEAPPEHAHQVRELETMLRDAQP
jgi:isopenicillin-N N-acyltransferase-like protein